jgi:hypothetical protein
MSLSTEARIVQRLVERFDALRTAVRCIYAQEVWLLTWGHISKGAKRVRADFVVSLDGGPLLVVECKGDLDRPAALGDALRQCSDYARAQVAGAQTVGNSTPRAWMSQPIRWAALAYNYNSQPVHVEQHRDAADRLFGPSNVGFLRLDKWQGLKFTLGADRYWSEAHGWRENAAARTVRIGSQREGVSE